MPLETRQIDARECWNAALRGMPGAHVLQTWEWGEFKRETVGWQPIRLAFELDGEIAAMASVGMRRIGAFKVMYCPRGPAMDYADSALVDGVLHELEHIARKRGALWMKIDPALPYAKGLPGSDGDKHVESGAAFMQRLSDRGWVFSDAQVQFRNTATLDLRRPLDDLLMAMSGNTRRKIRTATKRGVTVRAADMDDLDTLYALYRVTAERDNFLIRPIDYYRRAWGGFMRADLAQGLIAEYAGQPIAHVILFHFAQTCIYMYGASGNEERRRMPNYLLQWEAIKWAKARGCAAYDMWGAPDKFDESDPLWGVWGFKRGFRGDVVRTVGAWDYAPRAWQYRAYAKMAPWLRKMNRG